MDTFHLRRMREAFHAGIVVTEALCTQIMHDLNNLLTVQTSVIGVNNDVLWPLLLAPLTTQADRNSFDINLEAYSTKRSTQ
ncbi:hypothetical protein [Pectobacterium brasiliense]|uniref:hypothetical protein n=1 Tax=Pectobacterium brasiliense TaxID=180957 RepID=UPI003CF262D4